MAAPVAEKLVTAEQYAEMTIDAPVELVRGEVVEMTRPGMRHGVVCGRVYYRIEAWAAIGGRGFAATNDTGVITGRDPDTVRGPDVLYVSKQRLPGGEIPSGLLQVVPDLAVEVLSPTDVWKEVIEKVSEYLAAGVREVWVVDPELRNVQIFRPDTAPRTLKESNEIDSPDVLLEFKCVVSDFFTGL
ncbi:MAG: Uma2 family endonuclease [Planctomycetota bacterium]|nr:MAG: Uma2 family endonuclease [Planctomycetota bacterium]REJ91314.1 MAG: Uma2 family endonuclease [Planctomycetota bacterium]REK20924.1 MAG: Uma2 family endonuclease [Planctomycetota bacterium]REK37295.1 MAG: Uma2 family endonuclease [Planctomycetota bacterium]